MGGTTAKASLIRNGQYETTPEYEVGGGASGNRWMHGTGHPIRVPVIDLAEVSAGGGSIAWVDRAGALRVGPQSAGADPGPACYARGGTEPTVTDCNLRARLPRQGLAAGGRPAHRSRRGGSRGRQAPRRAAGRGRAHGGGGRHRRGQPRHGRDAQDRLRPARPRCAPVRAGGVRRRRPAACRRARGPARHRRGALPAHPRRVLGARPRRQRSQARLRAHRLHHHGDRRSRGAGGRLRRARGAGRRHARPRAASRRSGGGSSARSMRATSASPTSSPSPSPRARSTRRRCRRSPKPSTTATAPPTATTTAASRCSWSARASPPSARSRRC